MLHHIIVNGIAVVLLAALLGLIVAVLWVLRDAVIKPKKVVVEEPEPVLSKEEQQWAHYRKLSGQRK